MSARTLLIAAALILLVIACRPTAAQTVGVTVSTLHVPNRHANQAATPGLYFRDATGAGLSVYRNALGRVSLHLSYQLALGPLDLSIGAVSGHDHRCRARPIPAGHKALRRTYDCAGFTSQHWMPALTPSYALPPIGGLSPRLSLVLTPHSPALQLSVERAL